MSTLNPQVGVSHVRVECCNRYQALLALFQWGLSFGEMRLDVIEINSVGYPGMRVDVTDITRQIAEVLKALVFALEVAVVSRVEMDQCRG